MRHVGRVDDDLIDDEPATADIYRPSVGRVGDSERDALAVRCDVTDEASVEAARPDHYYDALDALAKHLKKNAKDLEVRLAMGDVSIAIANTKTDPQALRGYFADAQAHFEAAVGVDPKCEAAAVGLATGLRIEGPCGMPAMIAASETVSSSSRLLK